VVADRPAQNGIACFKRIEDGAQCGRTLNLKLYLAVNARQRTQVKGENHAYHGNA
jgi:hypothetical protein